LKKVNELDPDEDASHYLLARAYKKLGRTSEEKAELELFEKLRKAREGREQRARVTPSDSREEPEESDSLPLQER
jgi:hypothetical protein